MLNVFYSKEFSKEQKKKKSFTDRSFGYTTRKLADCSNIMKAIVLSFYFLCAALMIQEMTANLSPNPVPCDPSICTTTTEADMSPTTTEADMSPTTTEADMSPTTTEADMSPTTTESDISPTTTEASDTTTTGKCTTNPQNGNQCPCV